MKFEKRFWIRLLLGAAVLGLVGFLCVRFFVPMSHLLTDEAGREQLMEKIGSYGMFAPLILSGLMALQIIIAFIPGGPLELIAGMLFGGIKGTLFTMLGAVVGTLAV